MHTHVNRPWICVRHVLCQGCIQEKMLPIITHKKKKKDVVKRLV